MRITDPRLVDLAERATRMAPLARALDRATRGEAFVRRRLETSEAALRALTGWRSAAAERRGREIACAPGRAAPGAAWVHWHEGGDGEPLVLLNGWTASGLVWPDALVRCLEESHRVLRLDARGSGWSRSAPAPFTIADLAEDVRRMLDACDLTSATVLGLSMGGMVAQELALRHPARVDRLVLVSTRGPGPAYLRPAPGTAAVAMSAPDADLPGHLRRMWAAWCGPGFPDRHPEALDELVAQVLQRLTPRAAVAAQARAMAGWTGTDRLAGLDVPAVVVHGDVDRLMPVGNGIRLAQRLPVSRYVELPGVGHLPPWEAGADLARVIRSP